MNVSLVQVLRPLGWRSWAEKSHESAFCYEVMSEKLTTRQTRWKNVKKREDRMEEYASKKKKKRVKYPKNSKGKFSSMWWMSLKHHFLLHPTLIVSLEPQREIHQALGEWMQKSCSTTSIRIFSIVRYVYSQQGFTWIYIPSNKINVSRHSLTTMLLDFYLK